MSGWVSAFVAGLAYAFLMVLWKPLCIPRFLTRRLYLSSRMFTPVHTSLWRIMIPSIPLGMHSRILRRKGSIGGVPLLNRQTLIQLKIPYSQKIWRRIKFGGLAVLGETAKLKSAEIYTACLYVW